MSQEKLNSISIRMVEETQTFLERKLTTKQDSDDSLVGKQLTRSPIFASFESFHSLMIQDLNKAA